jgi:tRNA-modifying protein YgfZ
MTNKLSALLAARSSVAIYDCSDWGIISVSDVDRLRFLHNQSTADFTSLQPGQGCDTVFITSTARTIDLATAWVLEDRVLLLVSPQRRQYLCDWLDRYIFFADRVQLQDSTDRTTCLALIGPDADRIATILGGGDIVGRSLHDHGEIVTDDGIAIRLAVGSGLGLPGCQLIIEPEERDRLLAKIKGLGVEILNDRDWETLRIHQGRPAAESELTDEYNPLEVGLWQTISFSKGCYIGQETIARLNTYKGVKQYLWGIEFTDAVPIGTPLILDGEKVGILTSQIATELGYRGLAYLKSKAGGVGLKVTIGEQIGEVVDLPFISHEYPTL